EKATLESRSRFCTQARVSVVQIVTAPASHRNHTGTMCGDPSRRKVAITPSGVGKVWARNDSSSAVLMLMISYLSEGWQHARHRGRRATRKAACTTEQASDGATSFAVPQVRIAARGLLDASAQPLSDNLKWVLVPVPAPACPNTRTRAKAVPHVPGTRTSMVSSGHS